MIIETRTEKDIEVVKVIGNLIAENVEDLKEDLDKILHGNARLAIFDLEHLDEIDSSGIGTIVTLAKRMRKKNKDVRIYRLHGTVKKIFELLRIDKNIGVYEDWEMITS